ncbi:RNA polymerase sigma-70 factor, ECF subfamily [Lentzea xinjiangensis]|uniref:RNA polymerase sigma-70 factor, ECF subfamily n=1 Tax=Lentzea xinjiangensis TaxID=402600 RepID=A0A1H9JX81_9PSEU|nr:RNA polymerase subunit sigma-70 [Lentzea xinjiangensis]SEQ91417.1 RNA polymerase sigma-70 factor, ECF subfamily [Lentzea xinjiangensis]
MSAEVLPPLTGVRLHDEFALLRAGLVLHCYRMTGSYQDAEDVVQETYLRAVRGLAGFEGRSSLKTWLYRIATNTCVTALSHRSRRVLPAGLGAPASDPDTRVHADESIAWLEPLPDAVLHQDEPGEVVVRRESVRLALIAALQYLPVRQRAALLLREVLSWSAAEIADALGVSAPAVKSLLQRARKRLDELDLADRHLEPPGPELERALLDRYLAAFVAGDSAAIRAVIHDDFSLEAVPHPVWFRGVHVCIPFLERAFASTRGSVRMLPTRANGQPAMAGYRRDPSGVLRADCLWVLTLAGERFSRATKFENPALVTAAGLPGLLAG